MQNQLFSSHARKERIKAMGILLIGALALRLAPMFISSGGQGVLLLQDLPPLWGYLNYLLRPLAAMGGLPEAAVLKILPVLADAWIPILLLMILSRLAPEGPMKASEKAPPFWISSAFWLALAWAVNPLIVYLSAGQGSFHSLPLLAVLAAVWYVEFSQQPQSDLFAPLALSAAIALAWWPLAMLPLFLKAYPNAGQRMRFASLALVLPLLLSLPLLLAGDIGLLLPQAEIGLGALMKNMELQSLLQQFSADSERWLMLGGPLAVAVLGSIYLIGPWRFPLMPAMALASLLLLVFSFGAQRWMLGIPLLFALAVPGALALRLSLTGLGAALMSAGLYDPGALFLVERFDIPQVPYWFKAAWGLLNLALWYYWIRESLTLLQWCRRPARLRFR